MTWIGELPTRHQARSLAGNPDRPAQVLLVEDDTGFAFALRQSLVVGEHAAPLRIDHAGSLRAALDALCARGSDIILLDLTLPDAHGLAAIHEIRSAAPGTPIIVLTGHDDDALALQAMQAGAQDYLVKGQISGRLVRRAIRYAIEHKRLEEALHWSDLQLRQAQKMEAIGRLAGGVAHDFNSMLTIILSYSELLLRRLAEHDPNRHGLEEVRKAGLTAADLVGQLLAFSRHQVLQPQILDLNGIVDDLAHILRRLIGEDIELVTAPAKDLGLVKADPSQIQQVLLNLVVNARDAMSRGGKLTIETGNVDLQPLSIPPLDLPAGAYVMLAVSDTGVGISPAIQPRIFEPFFTTKAPGKGTGLGLATVYDIVKQHGGHILVYSEPGQGTSVKTYLPRHQHGSAADLEDQPGNKAPARGTETILLVEDEDGVREVAGLILRNQGYTIIAARDGAEALRLAQEHPARIDLLLTDVVMPGMSGCEIADLFRSAWPDAKIAYMTGYTESATAHHNMLAAGAQVLRKPFTPDSLARWVREILASSTAERAPGPA